MGEESRDAGRGAGRWGPVAHVLLGFAVAMPVLFLIVQLVLALTRPVGSALDRAVLIPLLLASLAGVAGVSLLGGIRIVEIAAARALLGLDLPDPVASTTTSTRLLGAAWLGLVALTGTVAGMGLLYLVPMGFGLLVFPFSGRSEFVWPGTTAQADLGSGAQTWWLVPLGLLAMTFAAGLVVAGGSLLVRWAPRFLGPTDADTAMLERLAARREAQAHTMARELHDAIGHALSAVTLQAAAARVHLRTDPDAADRSLAAIEDVSRAAVGELDAILGILRGGEGGVRRANSVADVVEEAGRTMRLTADIGVDADALTPPVAAAVRQVLAEGLANAARHGDGTAHVQVSQQGANRGPSRVVRVIVVNPLRPLQGAPRLLGDLPRRTRGHGLDGLREAMVLAGGSLTAGPAASDARQWHLEARIPASPTTPGDGR